MKGLRTFAWTMLLGCSGTAVTPGGGGGAVPPEQFVVALTEAQCARSFRCNVGNDNTTVRALFGTEANCARATQRLASADLEDLLRTVRDGRTRYDAAAARRCVDALRTSCDPALSFEAICGDVFVGTVAAGGQCFRHEECAGEAWCAGEDSRCPGVCTAQRDPGQACSSRAQCRGPAGECSNQVCVQVRTVGDVGEGQPCGTLPGDGGLLVRASCAAELSCRNVADTPSRNCQRPLPLGAPCRTGDACAGVSRCIAQTCTAVTVQNTAGAPCGDSTPVCNPAQNLICRDGTCASVGTGALGSACLATDLLETFSCNPGLFCDRTSMRCAALRAEGETCRSSRDCLSGACTQGRCAARRCELAPR